MPRSVICETLENARWVKTSIAEALDRRDATMRCPECHGPARPIALGRKNSLFAGSESGADRWASVASLIETVKLNGVEPCAWFRNSLTLMIEGHPVGHLDELLPWSWQESCSWSVWRSKPAVHLLQR